MVTRRGSRRVVIYQDTKGVLMIQPSSRLPNGKHRIRKDLIEFGNIKESPEQLGNKVLAMLAQCD